jgi:uncharacterized protein
MKKQIKKISIIVAGVFFILLGLVGLALPFLQGFLFLAIGLVLLSISSTRIRGWIESHTRRFPKVHAAVEKLERWVISVIGTVD